MVNLNESSKQLPKNKDVYVAVSDIESRSSVEWSAALPIGNFSFFYSIPMSLHSRRFFTSQLYTNNNNGVIESIANTKIKIVNPFAPLTVNVVKPNL